VEADLRAGFRSGCVSAWQFRSKVFGGADTNWSKVRDPVDVYNASCLAAKAGSNTRPRRSVFLRKPYLVRQGVGQTNSGGEEPAGRAERLRKGLFGGLEAVRTVGKSVFSVNRGSGFRIQAMLRCLTAVDLRQRDASAARRGGFAGQMRAEAGRSELLRYLVRNARSVAWSRIYSALERDGSLEAVSAEVSPERQRWKTLEGN
jgi:hypothetical protein